MACGLHSQRYSELRSYPKSRSSRERLEFLLESSPSADIVTLDLHAFTARFSITDPTSLEGPRLNDEKHRIKAPCPTTKTLRRARVLLSTGTPKSYVSSSELCCLPCVKRRRNFLQKWSSRRLKKRKAIGMSCVLLRLEDLTPNPGKIHCPK